MHLLHMSSSIHSFYGCLSCSVLPVSWHCSASYIHEFYLQFPLTPPPPLTTTSFITAVIIFASPVLLW
jgi:hypothetical protein